MTEKKIDEETISILINAFKKFIDAVQEDLTNLENKTTDIFIRYIAYSRLSNLFLVISKISPIIKDSFVLGSNLQDKIFHTEEYKKNEWDKQDNNPFFKEDKNDNDDKIKSIFISDTYLSQSTREELKNLIKKKNEKINH
jgi:hypothetical protein